MSGASGCQVFVDLQAGLSKDERKRERERERKEQREKIYHSEDRVTGTVSPPQADLNASIGFEEEKKVFCKGPVHH